MAEPAGAECARGEALAVGGEAERVMLAAREVLSWEGAAVPEELKAAVPEELEAAVPEELEAAVPD